MIQYCTEKFSAEVLPHFTAVVDDDDKDDNDIVVGVDTDENGGNDNNDGGDFSQKNGVRYNDLLWRFFGHCFLEPAGSVSSIGQI